MSYRRKKYGNNREHSYGFVKAVQNMAAEGIKKIRSSRKGDTIAEALVSTFVAAAACTILIGSVTASQKIMNASDRKMDQYYAEITEMDTGMVKKTAPEDSSETAKTVTVTGSSGTAVSGMDVMYYEYEDTKMGLFFNAGEAVSSDTYTITTRYVDTDGNSIRGEKTKTASGGSPFTVSAPTISRYVFLRWINQSGQTVSTDESYSFSATKSETLRAVYSYGVTTVIAKSTDCTCTYDGKTHTGMVSVISPASGWTVSYGLTEGNYDMTEIPEFTSVGTYIVYYKVTCPGYTACSGSFTVKITKASGIIVYEQKYSTVSVGLSKLVAEIKSVGGKTPVLSELTVTSSDSAVEATLVQGDGVVYVSAKGGHIGYARITVSVNETDAHEADSASMVISCDGVIVTINGKQYEMPSGYTLRQWIVEGLAPSNFVIVQDANGVEHIVILKDNTGNTYTVRYSGNGATGGSTASSSHVYGTAKNLTANGYVRTYTVTYSGNGGTPEKATDESVYIFTGWNTYSNGKGKSYSDEQNVLNLTATNGGTVTLYAQWKASTLILPSATREGFAFNGWKDLSSGKVYAAGEAITVSSDTVLSAQWLPTISFNIKARDSVTGSYTDTDTGFPEGTSFSLYEWDEDRGQYVYVTEIIPKE